MNIGFIIERNVYFKTFGPVIDKALELGHQVFCLHNYSQPRGGSKGYQFPDISQTPKFQNGQVVSLDYKTEGELIEKVLQNNIHVVVSLDLIETQLLIKNKLKEKGVFWVSLQSGLDSLAFYSEFLAYPDRFFIFSRDGLERAFIYSKSTGKAKENSFVDFEASLGEKVKKIGFWLTDQTGHLDRSAIKKEWGIPEDKKVVLLFPFPFGSSLKRFWTKYIFGWHNRFLQIIIALLSFNKRWIKQVWQKQNDFQLSKAIRQFCDNNNAVLLVKCRKKDPARRYLIKMADKVLYDEEFYPSTALKCFIVADVFFSFYSTGVMESAIMGASNICISPDEQDWVDLQNPFFQAISEEKKLFHWQGVSYKQTILEIIKNLSQKKISDFPFNKQEQCKYLQKFVDGKIDKVAENIVLEIEKMLEKE